MLDALDAAADELAAREAEAYRLDPTVGMAELLADLPAVCTPTGPTPPQL